MYFLRYSHEKKKLLRHRGTLKAAVITGEPKFKYLVVVSLYDTKPVYLISNACKKNQWTKKEQIFWNNEMGKKVDAPFYRLDLINEYNMGVGNVDQADLLRLKYRVQYWFHNQKWWFEIFFWCFELSLTNCFVLYRMLFELRDKSPPYSHYGFIIKIFLA